MPWPKAAQYKRFNVGQYMREKRQMSLAAATKTKQCNAVGKKLKRLEEKVSIIMIVYIRQEVTYLNVVVHFIMIIYIYSC